jgi:hypothetical protein
MRIESGDFVYLFNSNLRKFICNSGNSNDNDYDVLFTERKENAYKFRLEVSPTSTNYFSEHFSNISYDSLSKWQSKSFMLKYGAGHHLSIISPVLGSRINSYQDDLEENIVGKDSFRFVLKQNSKGQDLDTKFYIRDDQEYYDKNGSGVLFFNKCALFEESTDTCLNVSVGEVGIVPFKTRPVGQIISNLNHNTVKSSFSWMFLPEYYFEEGILNCIEKKTFEHVLPKTQKIYRTLADCNLQLQNDRHVNIGWQLRVRSESDNIGNTQEFNECLETSRNNINLSKPLFLSFLKCVEYDEQNIRKEDIEKER